MCGNRSADIPGEHPACGGLAFQACANAPGLFACVQLGQVMELPPAVACPFYQPGPGQISEQCAGLGGAGVQHRDRQLAAELGAGAKCQQPESPRHVGLQQLGGDLDQCTGPRLRPGHPPCSQPCLLRRELHRQTRVRVIGAGDHPCSASQRQRQAAARPGQVTQRSRIAGCLRWAELPDQQPDRRRALQRAQPELPEASRRPGPQHPAAGYHQRCRPLARHQRLYGRGGRRIINHYRQTPTGGHRLPQPLPACPAGRDGNCGDTEGPQPSAQHLPGRFTHSERTGQTGIELPFTELPSVLVQPPRGQRSLANARHTGNHDRQRPAFGRGQQLIERINFGVPPGEPRRRIGKLTGHQKLAGTHVATSAGRPASANTCAQLSGTVFDNANVASVTERFRISWTAAWTAESEAMAAAIQHTSVTCKASRCRGLPAAAQLRVHIVIGRRGPESGC